MSIVGCYSLDLYCDCPECKAARSRGDYGASVPETFNGYNRADSYRDARKAGWTINSNLPACWKDGHRKEA